jgi:hypothetical protein
MGYSIAMRAENKGLQKKMIHFMEENYTLPSILFGKENNYSRLTANCIEYASGLSYDNNQLAIGFDFNANGPERDYIFAITRWMALKIGAKKEFKGLGPVPYIAYDGGRTKDDRWPILIREQWAGKPLHGYAWCVVDSIGFEIAETRWIGYPQYAGAKTKKEKDRILKELIKCEEILGGMKFKKANKLICNELNRLDKLWQKNQSTLRPEHILPPPLLRGFPDLRDSQFWFVPKKS